MPELPEVETVRRGLANLTTGATVTAVDIRRDSCVRLLPGGSAEFTAAVMGSTLVDVARRGKFMWWVADDAGPFALSAHLGMSGQFRVHLGVPPEPHPHCRARLSLLRGGEPVTLDYLDQRTFGYLHAEQLVATADLVAGGQGSDLPAVPQSVAHIARDVLDPALDVPRTVAALRRGTRGIKQVLLDQTVVSGIGNIYADEALWHARVHPERPANAVSAAQARDLLAHTQQVMLSALAQGGTSFDALYVNVNGESGYFSRELAAYGRGGEPCGRCGRPMQRAMIGGRATHWCASCQRRARRPRT